MRTKITREGLNVLVNGRVLLGTLKQHACNDTCKHTCAASDRKTSWGIRYESKEAIEYAYGSLDNYYADPGDAWGDTIEDVMYWLREHAGYTDYFRNNPEVHEQMIAAMIGN